MVRAKLVRAGFLFKIHDISSSIAGKIYLAVPCSSSFRAVFLAAPLASLEPPHPTPHSPPRRVLRAKRSFACSGVLGGLWVVVVLILY